MSIIRYGFFGEDDAQQLFLRHYLVALAAGQTWHFEEDVDFPLKGGTKARVKAQFNEASELGLSRAYRHDCFFVGLDLDDHAEPAFRDTVRQMQEKLGALKAATMLLIPIQCIEHWLWYLKWQRDNPRATKNVSLETKTRREAKIELYDTPKPSTRRSNPIVEDLAAGMDFAWLSTRSTSFLAFHTQVVAYLSSVGLPSV